MPFTHYLNGTQHLQVHDYCDGPASARDLSTLMIHFEFVGRLPDIKETDCRMKSIENRQWHRHVCDYHPCPLAVELQVRWPETRVSLNQRVDEPHRNVGDEQECDNLSARSGNEREITHVTMMKFLLQQ